AAPGGAEQPQRARRVPARAERPAGIHRHDRYLHVLSDLLASIGTIVAALIIALTGWLHADPIASLVTTALIVRGAWGLVKEPVDVLLGSTPAHISLA